MYTCYICIYISYKKRKCKCTGSLFGKVNLFSFSLDNPPIIPRSIYVKSYIHSQQ